jgi:hypothetical protein
MSTIHGCFGKGRVAQAEGGKADGLSCVELNY